MSSSDPLEVLRSLADRDAKSEASFIEKKIRPSDLVTWLGMLVTIVWFTADVRADSKSALKEVEQLRVTVSQLSRSSETVARLDERMVSISAQLGMLNARIDKVLDMKLPR